jgi:hypothetical protein
MGSAIPYVVGTAALVGWVLGEEWLQRRTGQRWLAIRSLGWGVLSTVLALLLLYGGHLLGAPLALGLAVTEFASARRNWMPRGSGDLLERSRLESENRDSGAPAKRRPIGLGLAGWGFVIAGTGLWTLLQMRWGLSFASAGLITAVVGVVVWRVLARLTRPARSPGDAVDVAMVQPDSQHMPPFGHAGDQATIRDGEFTLSGRPARLVGWLLNRLSSRSNDRR